MKKATQEQIEVIRKTISDDPNAWTAAVAKKLGLTEGEVVGNLPEDMVTEIPSSEAQTVWESMTEWEKVMFIVRNGDSIFEISTTLPMGKSGHGYYNIHDKECPLGGHLKLDTCGFIYLVSKPFHKMETHSVNFFEHDGNLMFKVYVGRDENGKLLESVKEGFMTLKKRYDKGNI